MIFENDMHSFRNDDNTSISNFEITEMTANFSSNNSFILNSLQKIKNSTLCDFKRNKLEKFINEYTAHIKGFVEIKALHFQSENNEISSSFAKQSYNKVLIEQEYLNKIITAFNKE